jgi:MFS family permease
MRQFKKPFYGWSIVSMGVLGNALQGGFIFWTMGIYTSTFEDEFGAPRAQINLIETFLSVCTNLLSPIMGILIDRWSARHLMAIGIASLGLGLMILSQAGTLISVWAVWATLIPLGALGIGVLPSAALITRWFRRRRGLALGLSVTGSSIGGALVPPLVTWMFMSFGWRDALLYSGIFCLLFVPVFLKILVNFPEDIDLEQEEDNPDPLKQVGAVDSRVWTIPQMLRTSSFWWQTLISASLLAVTLGTLANLSLHAKDLGVTGQATALLYSVIAFCSFGSKVVMGHLIDRLGIKRSGYISAALLALGMLVLFGFKNYPGLVAASVVVGLGFGGVTPIWANMPARTFGARSMGRALGVMNPLHIPITGASAPLAGYISDTTGSYDLVFFIYMGLCAFAVLGLYLLKMPRPGEAMQPGPVD